MSSFGSLCFRVAQANSELNPVNKQDFQLELLSGANVKAIYVGRYDKIPPPYPHPGLPPGRYHTVMSTVRIPLSAFRRTGPSVSLKHVDAVRFSFKSPRRGNIYVDDVEFSQ